MKNKKIFENIIDDLDVLLSVAWDSFYIKDKNIFNVVKKRLDVVLQNLEDLDKEDDKGV